MNTPTQHMKVEQALVDSDIGGTTDITAYYDLANYDAITFIVILGNTFEGTPTNWNAADALDEFILRQATDSSGSDVKDITGAANDQTSVGAAGDIHSITVHGAALDVDGGFTHVSASVTEDDNTGVDIVQIIVIRHKSRYKHDDLTSSSHTVV